MCRGRRRVGGVTGSSDSSNAWVFRKPFEASKLKDSPRDQQINPHLHTRCIGEEWTSLQEWAAGIHLYGAFLPTSAYGALR